MYEKVRQFNHEPGKFDFEAHTTASIADFRAKQKPYLEEESEKRRQGLILPKSLGPQKHSKPDSRMIPGGEYFILDEVAKIKDRSTPQK